MKRSLNRSIFVGAIVGALALTGCSGGGSDQSGGAVEQVLHFGIGGEPPVLKPGNDQGNLGMTMNALIHRGLVTYDNDGSIIGGLAQEFEQISPDEYHFVLNSGAKFHDGTDVTVDSVRKTWEYYAQPENGVSFASAFADVESIDDEGEGAFTVHLNNNNGGFLEILADPNTPILPEVGLDPTVDNVIGAGPFVSGEHTPGVGWDLTKFDDFYEADSVKLEAVEIAFYPDGAARTNALLAGDIDLMDYVPWESFQQIESAGGFTVDVQNGPGNTLQFNTTVEPWNDPEVRLAAAYAINRQSLVDSVFEGYGLAKYGIAVKEGSIYDIPEATEMYEYDPEKAKQILADAGYPNGFETTLMNNSTYAFSQDTTLQIQADLEAIGITVNLDTPDSPTQQERLRSGEYDLSIGTIYAPVSDPSHVLNHVASGGLYHSFKYDNPELTKLLQDGRAAATEEEGLELYKQAFDIMKTDVPFVLFAQRGQAFGYSDSVQGFSTLPGFAAFYSAYTIADVEMK